MKFKLFITFCSLFFINLEAEEIDSWGKLVKKGNTYYKKSDNQPFTGVLKNLFPTGEISETTM